jgi:hypothetical protein
MGHWQVLKLLMVAEFWYEILICQDEVWSCVQEGRNITSMKTFLVVLFFLAAGGATRHGAFLLSEVELIRFGSNVAYLDIS